MQNKFLFAAISVIMFAFIFFFSAPQTAYAESTDTYLPPFDYGSIDDSLPDDIGIQFSELAEEISKLGSGESFPDLLVKFRKSMFQYFEANKKTVLYTFVIGIFSAIMLAFSGSFQNKTSEKMVFYICDLSVISLLFTSFFVLKSAAEEFFHNLNHFINAFRPVFLSSIVMTGDLSAGTLYEGFLVLLTTLTEKICECFLLPGIELFFICSLFDHLLQNHILKKISDLAKTILEWAMKAFTVGAAGFELIKNLMTPYSASLSGNTILKAVSTIPGIGNTASGAANIAISSGILIQNTIGIAGIVILILLTAVPCINFITVFVIYKGESALLEPFSEKRITDSIEIMGETAKMLFKLVLSGATIFLITIVLACLRHGM